MLCPKQQKTSDACVLVRKEWEHLENLFISKIVTVTESLKILCFKQEILLMEMVQVVKVFTEINLMMKTSKLSM